MKVTEQTRTTYTFASRAVALDCLKGAVDEITVTDATFSNKTWLKDGDEDKYEVVITRVNQR